MFVHGLRQEALIFTGMFLYANIIFGIIRELNEPDEIRTELRVLPESLDAA